MIPLREKEKKNRKVREIRMIRSKPGGFKVTQCRHSRKKTG